MQIYSTMDYVIGGLQLVVFTAIFIAASVYLINDFKKFKK